MKMILHLMRKDLLRLRWAWLLWTLLLVGEIVLAEFLLSPRSLEGEFFQKGALMQGLIFLGHLVAVGVLCSFQIMEDSLMGDQVFWRTRPIEGPKLVAAKLGVLLLLFWVWPAVVALPWWLYSGMKGLSLVWAVGQAGIINFAVIIPVWALATLSRNYARFLMASFLIGLTILVLLLVVFAQTVKGVNPGLILNVPIGLALAACLGVVLLQYLTRMPIRAKVIFIVGLLVAAALVWLDPHGTWFPLQAPARSLPGGGQLQPHLTNSSLNLSQAGDPKLRLEFHLQGGTNEFTLLAGTAKCRFEWPDGTFYVVEAPMGRGSDYLPPQFFGIEQAITDPETEVKRAEMREEARQRMAASGRKPTKSVDQPWLEEGRWHWRWIVVTLPVDIAERLVAEPPQAKFDFRFQFGRTVQLSQIPLRARETVARGGVRLNILDVVHSSVPEKNRESVDIIAVYAAAQTMQFYQIDRERGAVYGLNSNRTGDAPFVSLSRNVVRTTMQAYVPRLWRTDHWVLDIESVNRSILVATAVPPTGYIAANLGVEKLKLGWVNRGRVKASTDD